MAYCVSIECGSLGRGRPHFEISRYQLEYLRSLSSSWTAISSLLGVSRMTIFRRWQEFGMVEDHSRELNDDELRTVLTQLRRELAQLGERMVIGRLRFMGHFIARVRLHQAIRATDPISTALRWQGGLTARRPYSLPGPNSLWHSGRHMYILITSIMARM